MGVSVVLLTHDSERRLRACLDSVRFADEVVALDGGSTDGTLALLAAYGCLVHPQPLDTVRRHRGNFDVARNAGFALAREPWTLVVDSDEEVSDALRAEILEVTARPAEVAYAIPRRNVFLGRASRVLGDDFQLRLFPRGAARYEGSLLDARPVVTCPVAHLAAPLIHHQADAWWPLLVKLHRRTSQRARVLRDDPDARREPAWPLFYHTFRYHYRHLGTDAEGLRGALLAALFAAYPALAQAKLRRLETRVEQP